MMDGASPAMETEKSETPMPCEAGSRGGLPLPRAEPAAFVGKHRLAASITHLQNQINFIQEELEELETIGESSLVCKELISSIASVPDPLLPATKGPADVGWERWFLGDHHARRNKRWI
ncbi:guanine nucleotide-binding protein subunit gamma 2-like [Rhodamnia argentea]|uniref:Guanine nucleotide-binding protein subunit gamma 2-like n=1 Tax=Rhodamnia argentea TaxID=178133 RepID=A0A8B8PXN4_9MYRT|nr:guanine nucleotide-binding protein subunit gamma 2-like [Rhodamnia argentea]